MEEMFDLIEENGIKILRFKEIKPQKLDDKTAFCTLQDLIDLLGEEKALNLYAIIKTIGGQGS